MENESKFQVRNPQQLPCSPGQAAYPPGARIALCLALVLGMLGPSTAATVDLIAPAHGTVVAASTDITLEAQASDSAVTVIKIDFYDGTTKLGETVIPPYSIAWTGASAGTHWLMAIETDANGTLTPSAPVEILVTAGNCTATNAVGPAASLGGPASDPLAAAANQSPAPGPDQPEIYFGQDLSPYAPFSVNQVPRPAHLPESDAAADTFLARLPGVATETFESFAAGTVPTSVTFGTNHVSLTGGQAIVEVADPTSTINGEFPISGSKGLELVGNSGSGFFGLEFSAPQAALGFYATDIELNGLNLTLYYADGSSNVLTVPVTIPQGTAGALFYGIIDRAHPFVRVELSTTGNFEDGFLFDNLTLATAAQLLTDVAWPTVSVQDAPLVNLSPGAGGAAVFGVSLAPASTNSVTVEYATFDGTALAGRDYFPTNGLITFAPGLTNATIAIPLLPRSAGPTNQWLGLQLQDPVNAALGRCQAEGAILRTPNAPPTLSRIADQQTDENKPTAALPFTIGDAETAATALQLTAISSNPVLVPNDLGRNILLAGTGTNRTLTLIPATNQTGVATITLTVQDAGGLQATSSFVLMVLTRKPLLTIALTSPPNHAVFCPGSDLPIVASVQSTAPVARIEFYEGTDLVGTNTGDNLSFTLDKARLPAGDYTLTAKVLDAQGNSAVSAPVDIAVSESCGDVAIIRNFPDPEIDRLSGYLFEIGLSARVFDRDGLTFEMLQPYSTVIWDDLGQANPGLSDSQVAVLLRVQTNGAALYLIGEQLAASAANLSAQARAAWTNLAHLSEASGTGCDGWVHVQSTVEFNPLLLGRFGSVTDFFVGGVSDSARMTGTDAEVFGRCGDLDVLVGYPGFEAVDTGQPRVFTQNVRVATGGDASSIEQRKSLFQNVMCWLHHCECSTFDVVLEGSASTNTIAVGADVTYTITLSHNGECEATGAVLTDLLPAGLAFKAVESSQGSCSYDPVRHAVICQLGHLAKASSTPVAIVATALAGGTWTNWASVRINAEANTNNNSAAMITLVQGSAARLQLAPAGAGQLQLNLLGTAGTSYTVQRSVGLPGWVDWRTNALGPAWSTLVLPAAPLELFRIK